MTWLERSVARAAVVGGERGDVVDVGEHPHPVAAVVDRESGAAT